jgi:hypothetical protein
VCSLRKEYLLDTYIRDKESTDKATQREVLHGEYQLVFISPEALFLAVDLKITIEEI